MDSGFGCCLGDQDASHFGGWFGCSGRTEAVRYGFRQLASEGEGSGLWGLESKVPGQTLLVRYRFRIGSEMWSLFYALES